MDLRFSEEARKLLAEFRRENPSETLVIMIGGGCCENTAPILLKNFRIGNTDHLLGEAEGVKVYAAAEMFPLVERTPSMIGVTETIGLGSFSLEISRGVRLTLRPVFD